MKKWYLLMVFGAILMGILSLIFIQAPIGKSDETPPESPNGRYEWRMKMRGGSWQPEKMIAASHELRDRAKKMAPSKHKRDAGLNKWTELGPGNFSGRVRGIAAHPSDPDILFVGGVSGGLWKTTDAGSSWAPLNDFLPSLSVTSILIHPTGPDTMYISTGEALPVNTAPGAGIFKSIDGGDTWNLIEALDPDNLSSYYWINKIIFDPNDYTTLYAAAGGPFITSPGGCGEIFKITNSGANIVDLNASSFCLGAGLSVAVPLGDSAKIYACFAAGLLVSENGGTTWTQPGAGEGFLALPGRVEVAIDPANQSRVYALCQTNGLTGMLMHSLNAGETWSTVNPLLGIFDPGTGTNNGWYHNVVWVDPTNADVIIVGGVNLWRSTNRGLNFLPISDKDEYLNGLSPHADHHVIIAATGYGPTNKKVYVGNDGGIASTDNIATVGTTAGWNLLNGTTLGTTQFYASGTRGQNPNYLIGGSQDNGTLLSVDNGVTWTHEVGGDGGYCGISQQDPNLRYASSQNGDFQVYGAGGLNFWFPLADLSTMDNPDFIAPMLIYPNDGEKVLLCGEKLWYRPVLGSTVEVGPTSSPGITITALDMTDDSSLVVIGYNDGTLQKAVPGIWSWTSIPVSMDGCLWGGPITDIAIHPTNADRLMVSRGGYTDCNVAYSNDGGSTWEHRSSGIPDLHINCLTWHPDINGWIYAGTDLGILASEDSGQNWNITPNFVSSDGPAFVEVTEISFALASVFGLRTMTISTYGRGFWKTNTTVRKDVYVDEDCTNCGFGTQSWPYELLSEAEDNQAHGQKWTIDAGTYPTSSKVVLGKRLGKINTTNGTVVLGQN